MSQAYYGTSPSIYRGAAMQARSIRQQQYRMGSLPQSQQGALQARVHPTKTELLTDVPILTGSPSRQYMSHDFGQVRVQSKLLEPSMFSPTYGLRLPTLGRDAGQIKPSVTTPSKAEAPVNFYVPLGGGGFAMPRNAPVTPIASSFALKPKSTGGMGSVEFEYLVNSAFLTCIATGTSAGLRHRR
jgi:hypothetical protein